VVRAALRVLRKFDSFATNSNTQGFYPRATVIARTEAAPALRSTRRAFVQGGPGGQDIIHEDKMEPRTSVVWRILKAFRKFSMRPARSQVSWLEVLRVRRRQSEPKGAPGRR